MRTVASNLMDPELSEVENSLRNLDMMTGQCLLLR